MQIQIQRICDSLLQYIYLRQIIYRNIPTCGGARILIAKKLTKSFGKRHMCVTCVLYYGCVLCALVRFSVIIKECSRAQCVLHACKAVLTRDALYLQNPEIKFGISGLSGL